MHNNITPESIVTEIIMSQSDKEHCWLLLEGETDSRIFEHFKSKQSKCHIRFFNGKPSLKKVVEDLNQNNISNFIVIIDADFKHLGFDDGFPHGDNIFCTDYHDIEMMMLDSNALNKVLNEYTEKSKKEKLLDGENKQTLLDLLLDKSKYIALLMFKSTQNNWGLSFDNINYYNFYNTKYNIANLVKIITDKSTNKAVQCPSGTMLIRLLRNESNYNYDLKQLCRGHDTTFILALIVSNEIKEDKYQQTQFIKQGKNLIEVNLRLAYDFLEFQKSQLYNSIIKWEESNQPFRIF